MTIPLKLVLSQRRSERGHKAPRSFHPMKSKISALFSSIIMLILHTDLSHLTTDLWSFGRTYIISDATLSLSVFRLLIFDSPLLCTSCVPIRTQICAGFLFTSHLYCISHRVPTSARASWHHCSLNATSKFFLINTRFSVLARQ